MEIIIRSYTTAVDDNDPEKGNHKRYSVEIREKEGAKNIPGLGEFDLIETIASYLK